MGMDGLGERMHLHEDWLATLCLGVLQAPCGGLRSP